jgi:hypothetical protein
MDVTIGEVNSTVQAVDGDSVLSRKAMEQVVRAALRAVRADQEHEKRVRAETKVTRGVSHEQAEEDQ